MKSQTMRLVALAASATALCATSLAAAVATPRVLGWEDLMPPQVETPPPPPRRPGAEVPEPPPVVGYSARPVPELDGQYVKLPGFIVPLESDEGGLIDEFLLVPYFGACIHVPPPPPNQLVYVKLKKPFDLKNMWEPYWVTGTINTRQWISDFADSEYTMTAERLDLYEIN